MCGARREGIPICFAWVINGLITDKGLRDTLVLLSVCETCKCKNVDFPHFLLIRFEIH